MHTILVVEDQHYILDNITDLLEGEGYDVLGAEGGQEGIDLALAEKPDLILCDIMMPKVDGYAVLRAVRADADLSTIPFIFLTAKSSQDDYLEARELGADDFIVKPFVSDELIETVRYFLEE